MDDDDVLELTADMVVRDQPTVLETVLEETDGVIADEVLWENANKLLDHVRGCRCSTCELAASLGAIVRFQENHD